MFGLTAIEERLAFFAIIALLVVGFGLFYTYHERGIGAQKCEMDDAKVAAIQTAAAHVQEAIDAKRLKDAQDGYQDELVALQRSRAAEPVSHLVCVAPRSVSVSAAGEVSAASITVAGPLSPERTFDPGPALDGLHDEADDIVAACRELNNAVPH